MSKYSPSTQYFAAMPKDEIGAELDKRVGEWEEFTRTNTMYARMLKSQEAYYGFHGSDLMASEIGEAGIKGELNIIKINHFRNILQHMLVMTTSQRPAAEARAINTDYESISQTVLANGILEYYMRDRRLERFLKMATEISLVLGEGYVGLEWDVSAGDPYIFDEDEQRMVYTGDIKYSAYTPFDIIKDIFRPDAEDQDWYIAVKYKNRFDLAAKYPEYREDILQLETLDSKTYKLFYYARMAGSSDLISEYHFYHKRSEALPEGRHVIYLGKDIILHDGPLPYDKIPIYRVAPGEFIGTNAGYTPAFDLLAIQDAIDVLYSTVITNQTTFGVQNIMVPRGHAMEASQLSGGLNMIEYDPQAGKPEPLNLTHTPPEIFNFIKMLEQTMETISGVNSVARGNPEASLRSGSALALVQSMALQFNSGLQQAYAQLLEDVCTATLHTLRDFAHIPRIAAIVGKNNRSYLKEFRGSDLEKINRVIVDVGNPLAKTTAGKMEIASDLLQQGMVKTPQEYLMVLKTGNLDPLYEGEFQELTLIKSENEKLARGEAVQATLVDSHVEHIKEHKSVLASPESRENPKVVSVSLAHIQDHINMLSSTDPNVQKVLAILEQPSLADQGQGGAPQPEGPGAGASPTQMAAGAENMGEVMGTETPLAVEAAGVRMPSMPTDALTGEPFEPGLPPELTPGIEKSS